MGTKRCPRCKKTLSFANFLLTSGNLAGKEAVNCASCREKWRKKSQSKKQTQTQKNLPVATRTQRSRNLTPPPTTPKILATKTVAPATISSDQRPSRRTRAKTRSEDPEGNEEPKRQSPAVKPKRNAPTKKKPLKRLRKGRKKNSTRVKTYRDDDKHEEHEDLGGANESDTEDPNPSNASGSGSRTYVVEAVVGKDMIDDVLHYKIHWQGYPKSEDSWERADSCHCYLAIKAFEDKQKKVSGSRENFLLKRSLSAKSETPTPLNKKMRTSRPLLDMFHHLLPPALPIVSINSRSAKSLKRHPLATKVDTKSVMRKTVKAKTKPAEMIVEKQEKESVAVPWHILTEKVQRTIPQIIKERLQERNFPDRLVKSINPATDSDEGFQRYLCEWQDGITSWLPGKLCCKLIPSLICEVGIRALPGLADVIG